jgi:hypothetical protein
MENAICFEYNHDMRTYHNPVKLPTQDELQQNLYNYILSRKEFILKDEVLVKNTNVHYDPITKIVTQFDVGETFKTGSYDRYVVFRNFPEADFVCTIYKMGLIQVAYNPFKSNNVNIHLGEISKELYSKWKNILNNFRIPISAIKRIAEDESFKLKQKFANYLPIGFTWNDLVTFYGDSIFYQPNRKIGDLKTVEKLNTHDSSNSEVQYVKERMSKLYDNWDFNEKQEMMSYKIPAFEILQTMSGGHTSITNLQGFNYLDERPDAIIKYFGSITIPKYNNNGDLYNKYISNSEDLMQFFATEYLQILKSKIV